MSFNYKLAALIIIMLIYAGCKKDEESNETNQPNQPDQSLDMRYECISGNCLEQVDGYFSSLAACDSICGDTIMADTADVYNIVYEEGEGVEFHGHTYTTVVLGNGQEWMSENLRTSKYANGDPLVYMPGASTWPSLTQGGWCIYDNEGVNEQLYGGLYNWYAVADNRNLCPSGWRVPFESDWIALIEYLDTEGNDDVNDAGGKMKVKGTDFWLSPNEGATNESGFSAYPAGWRLMSANYVNLNTHTMWWSRNSNPNSNNSAWARMLYFNDADVDKLSYDKRTAMSVRCIKN